MQQVPRVQGHCNSSSHRCHPITCSCGLQLKILPAKDGCKSSCPRCHWSMHFLFLLLFFSSSRAHFVGLYSCCGDLRGMHCFPTSIAVSSGRLREVAQTLFYTLSLFVRLVLNNKAKKKLVSFECAPLADQAGKHMSIG